VTFDVPKGGGTGTLKLLDASGKEVATRSLGSLPAGRKTLDLPADLPAGTYTYKITVDGPGGKAQAATTYVSGTVDTVLFKNGGIVLNIGGIEVAMDTLSEIDSAAPTHS
jgi:flagellar hook assembly protein FlgD